MKIQIDIGHPAHVHYFKNFYRIMSQQGHVFLITARQKEVSHDLLKSFGIPFIDRGMGSNSMAGKVGYLPKANWILLKQALKFKPDLFLSFSSPYAAQVSTFFSKPHIAFDDTEHARLGQMMYRPFTDVVLSPDSYKGEYSQKQKLFNGYMELLYLHPNYFIPDDSVFELLDITKKDKYIILRFVSWQATHDTGHSGMSLENKRKAVQRFSKHGRVFISSEEPLPDDLKPYHVNVPPEKIHDILFYASMFFGESATMASESAMLGTPAIYLDNEGRGYTDDLEKNYGLVFNYTESAEDQIKSIQKGEEILNMENTGDIFQQRREKMLSEKIDVTSFLIEFVEDFMQNRL